MQAKHLDAHRVLAAIYLCHFNNLGAMLWDVERHFADVPPKVLRAKLRSLIRQRKITGCDCGCRGDFQVVFSAIKDHH